jgi:hypothetical protein
MTRQHDEGAYLAAQLMRASLEVPSTVGVAQDVAELRSIARQLHRWHERDCNGYQDGRGNEDVQTAERAERTEARLMAQAGAIAASYGLVAYEQTDPRGWPLYLMPASVPTEQRAAAYSSYIGVSPR